MRPALIGFVLAALCAPFASPPGRAAEEPVFEIEMKDGVIVPARIEVPAKTRFKIILKNSGQMPAEFESLELRKEVVVTPGGTAAMIIRTLDAGEYKFFDDFQPGAPPALLIAK
jgi:uncharacterized protein (DUF58 family)